MSDGQPTEVLLGEGQIRDRVRQLAQDIERDHPEGVHLVGVLKGAFVFLSDLARQIRVPVWIDYVAASSYGDTTTSSGAPRLLRDVEMPIQGCDVVLVEDIVDEGRTLDLLQQRLLARGPRRLRTACLLDKPARRQRHVQLDYIGFAIEDRFVVGYGLDYAGRYRNLPYIAVLKQAAAGARPAD